MNNEEQSAFTGGVVLGVLLVTAFWTIVGATVILPAWQDSADRLWQADAISRGVAEYDKITGEWKWTVEKVKAGE
jgi:hypothetical protein